MKGLEGYVDGGRASCLLNVLIIISGVECTHV